MALRSIAQGRGGVREGKPIEQIDLATIDATLGELTPIVADMVRLQLVSGARPGEIYSLPPGQLDRSGEVWLYRPAQHKTRYRGKERVVCFGPQAQTILTKYLLRADDQPCFSPVDGRLRYLRVDNPIGRDAAPGNNLVPILHGRSRWERRCNFHAANDVVGQAYDHVGRMRGTDGRINVGDRCASKPRNKVELTIEGRVKRNRLPVGQAGKAAHQDRNNRLFLDQTS